MSGLQGFLSKTNAVYVELTHIHCIWCNAYLLCIKQLMMMYHSIGSGETQQQKKKKKIRKESLSSVSFSCLSFFSDLQIPSGGTLHNRSRYQLLSLMFWNPCSSLFQEDVTLCSHIEIWFYENIGGKFSASLTWSYPTRWEVQLHWLVSVGILDLTLPLCKMPGFTGRRNI